MKKQYCVFVQIESKDKDHVKFVHVRSKDAQTALRSGVRKLRRRGFVVKNVRNTIAIEVLSFSLEELN